MKATKTYDSRASTDDYCNARKGFSGLSILL